MLKKYIREIASTNIGAVVGNIIMVYVAMMISRLAFFAVNWSMFAPYMSWALAGEMLHGAIVFDTSAILYINALYIVLSLFPLHWKESPVFHCVMRWLFTVTNAVALAANLGDAVYFQYTGRRSTATLFSEFANEGNILSIVGSELFRHWYLLLLFVLLVAALYKAFLKPSAPVVCKKWKYYTVQVLSLLILTPASIFAIRGSFTAGTRPMTISNANEYVNRPIETAVVLNTPFSIIRTIGKKVFVTPSYMSDAAMEAAFTPLHHPVPVNDSSRKNVVIIILESMGKEYMGFYNRHLDNGSYKGYTPFLDSIASQSLTFKYSFANGRKSMDAMPSILSSIPMFVETFFLTPASLNNLDGIARQLGDYHSAYFHGGHNETLGFNAFTHSTGFKGYRGLTEYNKSPKYHGMDDFDGKWAIWDEEFFQFLADNQEESRQPFLTAVFSATSHHPYRIPMRYKARFPEEGGLEIHKCIRYTDMSLQRYFERVSKMPWYKNTLFVITADHTNENQHAEYQTDLGLFAVPIIFFTPDGSLKPQMRDDMVAQQIDIMPTVLSYLGRKTPYVAFGIDLLTTPADKTWAVNYNNGIYQYVKGDYLMQFDGSRVRAMYRYKTDVLLLQNLVGKVAAQAAMEHELKAVIQQYMQRMNANRMTVE